MKIKLLNDGGYKELKDVKYPVVVDGFEYEGLDHCVGVDGNELLRICGDDCLKDYDLAFLVGLECEIIHE